MRNQSKGIRKLNCWLRERERERTAVWAQVFLKASSANFCMVASVLVIQFILLLFVVFCTQRQAIDKPQIHIFSQPLCFLRLRFFCFRTLFVFICLL
jgi:hypothetical protein